MNSIPCRELSDACWMQLMGGAKRSTEGGVFAPESPPCQISAAMWLHPRAEGSAPG